MSESSPPQPDFLAVQIRFSLGDRMYGMVTEISADTLMVDFPSFHEPSLDVGETCKLQVASARKQTSLDVQTVTRRRIQEETRVRYHMVLTPGDREALMMLLEGRSVFRYQGDPETPIGAWVLPTGSTQALPGNVLNLSRYGMSIGLPKAEGERILQGTQVSLRVQLPTDQGPLDLQGIVRNQRAADMEVHLGVEYQAWGAKVFVQAQERIERFIRTQQTIILKQLGELATADTERAKK